MAINNDDKKFIKDTIDNALSNYEKKSDDKLKKYEENRKKLSKQEREDYIAILQKKNEQGEATLAQKFEMLKLSVENAVPEDLKDAFSSGKKAVKGGLNQAGRGLEHITGRIMETNPLTALLWQNRDLIKAGLDIGVGGIRAVGGVAKGAALGAAGLFNQALNMRKKQQAEETDKTEDDVNVSRFSPVFGTSKENPVAEILEQKQDWQKQIDDIHKILIKQNKEQNVSNKTLSEGLGGLGKTMTTVKGFVDLIQSKQKLILAGVLVGVAALVGLAMWFQNGGMSKLFDNLFGPNKGTKPTTSQDIYSNVDQQFQRKQVDRLQDISKGIKTEAATGNIQEVKKSFYTSTNKDGTKNSRETWLNSGYKINAKASQPYRAPFDLKIINWSANEQNPKGVDMEVERTDKILKKNSIIMNVENPTRVPGQTAKKGEIIGYVPSNGQIYIKDIDLKDFQSYKSMIDQYANRSNQEKLSEIQAMSDYMDAGQSDKIRNTFKALELSTLQKQSGKQWEDGKVTEKDAKNIIKDNPNGGIATEQLANHEAEMYSDNRSGWQRFVDDKIRTTFTSKSENWDRAKQQEEQLKQKPKQQENWNGSVGVQQPPSQTQSTISVDEDKTAYVFSDVQLSQAQYGAMTGNLMNLNIA